MVLVVVGHGYLKKVDLFENFIKGSTQGFKLMLTVFPNLLAMVFSVNILLTSGFLDFLISLITPIIKLPIEIISLGVIRPISGNAALAILNNIFQKYGVDSLWGLMGSAIQGSTDTTFYVLALYYGSVGIKKIRYAPLVSILADITSIVSAIIICNFIF